MYSSYSPYFTTEIFGNYLDILNKRNISREKDDVLYTIQQVYQYRPDLLSYDLYGTPSLWWVFITRNPNTLKDPIWDFTTGTKIFLPKQSTINESLGL